MTTRILVMSCLVAGLATTAWAQQPGSVRRAAHQRNIQQLHEPVRQVSFHADCCGGPVGCGDCGACSSCCVCRPCFPLLRGIARRIDCALTNLLTCNACCGRPVCGPSGCGCGDPFESSSGCADCGGHGHGEPVYMAPPHMAPTPAPGNPFQDDPTPATPSSYRRPVQRTKACTSCGSSSAHAASSRRVSADSDVPRVVAPVGSAVKQASFATDQEQPAPAAPQAPSRAARYRR